MFSSECEVEIWRSAVGFLYVYHDAQLQFHSAERYPGKGRRFANPTDGRGLPDLYEVRLESGSARLDLLQRGFANALSPSVAFQGYYYVNIVRDENGPYDYAKHFGLCAVPAKYTASSRSYTLVINHSGAIYRKDNGGKAIVAWPDLRDGWERAATITQKGNITQVSPID